MVDRVRFQLPPVHSQHGAQRKGGLSCGQAARERAHGAAAAAAGAGAAVKAAAPAHAAGVETAAGGGGKPGAITATRAAARWVSFLFFL